MSADSLVPVFYLNQDFNWEQPAYSRPRPELRKMKLAKEGKFVSHGTKFQLSKRDPACIPAPNRIQPDPKDRGHDGHGMESCKVDEPPHTAKLGLMSRFVARDRRAVAIVEMWMPRLPIRKVELSPA